MTLPPNCAARWVTTPSRWRSPGKTMLVDELTPAEFLHRIAGSPHLIETPGAFGEAGRTSIRDLLAVSVDGLDEETRSVFFAFGALFAPQATPEMIALAGGTG